MNIGEVNQEKFVKFVTIKKGETFQANQSLYMAITTVTDSAKHNLQYNAIRLRDGDLFNFGMNDSVVKRDDLQVVSK